MDTELPKKGNKIFVTGINMREFAYIDGGNKRKQFLQYIIGYKTAADITIDHALSDASPEILDTCIFPACFLYRQYLELVLKDIYLRYSNHGEEKKFLY
jgi:hypothetical protein